MKSIWKRKDVIGFGGSLPDSTHASYSLTLHSASVPSVSLCSHPARKNQGSQSPRTSLRPVLNGLSLDLRSILSPHASQNFGIGCLVHSVGTCLRHIPPFLYLLYTNLSQIRKSTIIELSPSRTVPIISKRNKDNHTLPCTSQKNTVCIL